MLLKDSSAFFSNPTISAPDILYHAIATTAFSQSVSHPLSSQNYQALDLMAGLITNCTSKVLKGDEESVSFVEHAAHSKPKTATGNVSCITSGDGTYSCVFVHFSVTLIVCRRVKS